MTGVMDFGTFCRQQGLPDELLGPLCDELLNRERARLHLEAARAQALANARAREKIPLAADGDEFGEIEARIPINSFMYWGQRPDVGWDCWSDDGFINEYLRDNPQSRVKTVQPNGRIVVGYSGPPRRTVKRYENR